MSWGDIFGWTEPATFEIYDEAVATAPTGATLVEIGVAFGRSLAYLARKVIDAGRHDLVVLGVDPWIPEDWLIRDCQEHYVPHGGFYEAYVANMKKHAPEEFERVISLQMTSVEAAQVCARTVGTIKQPSFVYIDGDHTYEGAKADVEAWRPIVTSGGVFAGHDYKGFIGVERAVREAFGVEGQDFTVRGSCWWRRM